METVGGSRVSRLSVEELLGRRLNDVERKFAPRTVHTAGPMSIPLPRPRVSIVGSRKASPQGLAAAGMIASTLAGKDVVIISGLAEGIDTSAHKEAIASDGRTIAVLGTPLNRMYPKKNSELQQQIIKNHLAISQFPMGHVTTPKDFVIRNRTMALISDATIIVEAGDTSGSLHQGWEALRLGRSLFIWETVMDVGLKWPEKMLEYGAMILSDPRDVLETLPSSLPPSLNMIDVLS